MLNEVKPYFFYSPYNSIRMAESVVWNPYNKPKTVANTLSYQEDGLNTKDFYQLFQFNDAVRTQFKSSYSNHSITINGCDGSVRNIEPIKRTENLNISDYRSVKKISVDGKLVIYFGQGDILNTSTGVVIESYNLKQYVPSWMKEGKNIDVNSVGEVAIEKIIWLSEQGLYGLKTNKNYSSTAIVNDKVKSIYNKFEYNIYEFDLDFYLFTEGKYQIEIKATNTGFEDVTYLSERLYLKDFHENTHLFISSHNKNTQINYSWSIQHMMRLQYETQLKYSPDGENNIHKTDNNTFLLNGTVYENYEAQLSPLPTGMAIKTTMFLSLRELFVDTRSYVADAKPTSEKLGDTNLYDYKVKLILSNEDHSNRNSEFSTMVNSNNAHLKVGGGYLKTGVNGFLIIGK